MADFSCASTKRTSHWPAPMSWEAPVRFRVSVVVAALVLPAATPIRRSISRRRRPPRQPGAAGAKRPQRPSLSLHGGHLADRLLLGLVRDESAWLRVSRPRRGHRHAGRVVASNHLKRASRTRLQNP